MNNNKVKLDKRIKWLRITLFAGVFLVISHLIQLIFYSEDNFRIFMNGSQFILFTIFTISSWYQIKQTRKKLPESGALRN